MTTTLTQEPQELASDERQPVTLFDNCTLIMPTPVQRCGASAVTLAEFLG
jgi:hypothetical protein